MKIAKHVFCATAVLAGLLLLGACSKSDADSDAGAKTQKYVIKLSATLDSSATKAGMFGGGQEIDLESGLPTKVSLSDPGSGMKVYWSMNDAIEVGYVSDITACYQSSAVCTATHKTLTTTGNSGSSTHAQFSGDITVTFTTSSSSQPSYLEAFYPASATFTTTNNHSYFDKVKYLIPGLTSTFDLSTQMGYNQFAQNDFGNIMYALCKYSIPSGANNAINVSLKFKPATAILKINLTFATPREFNGKVVISTVDSNNKLIVAGTLEGNPSNDFSKSQASLIATSATRGDVTINTGLLSSGTITSIPTVYVAVIGQTLNSELVITAGGLTATTTSVKGKKLEGGKVYTINKTLTAPGTPTP